MGCRYVNTLLKLVPQVLALQEQLREAVQNGDMEACHGICRIAVTLGENHSRCVRGCFSDGLYQCRDFIMSRPVTFIPIAQYQITNLPQGASVEHINPSVMRSLIWKNSVLDLLSLPN